MFGTSFGQASTRLFPRAVHRLGEPGDINFLTTKQRPTCAVVRT